MQRPTGPLSSTALTVSGWLAACASAALLAGCGSGGASSTGTKQTTPPVPTTPRAGTSGTTTAPRLSTSANVAACRKLVAGRPDLSAKVKTQLDGLCAKAATNNPVVVREVAAEICTAVVSASPLRGDARNQALAACKVV